MSDGLETLVAAGIRAPSGDNMQPWKLVIDEQASAIKVEIDPSRDPSPMNAGQRMARIAVGAAAENILTAATHNGWQTTVDQTGEEASSIILRVEGVKEQGEIPSRLLQRASNRRLYRGTPADPAVLAPLENAEDATNGVRTICILERDKLLAWSRLVGSADALMFGIRAVRKAFVENIRFDRDPREEVDWGLSLGSLELSWSERLGIGLLGSVPDLMFRAVGMGRALQKKASQLVQSASGVCILVASRTDPATDYHVGQVMQRVWLQLTELGLSVQPMMSLPVLDNMRGEEKTNRNLELSPKIGSLMDACLSELRAAPGERIAAILRFGQAASPSGRTGRRPTDNVVRREPGSMLNRSQATRLSEQR
jgi:nitroreductase